MEWTPDINVIAAERRARLARLGGYPKPAIIRRAPTQEDILRAELAAKKAQFEEERRQREEIEAARRSTEAAKARAALEAAERFAAQEHASAIDEYLAATPHTFELIDGSVVTVPWGARARSPASMRFLLSYIAHQSNIDYDQLIGVCRHAPVVQARFAAIAASIVLFPVYSLTQIGGFFDRDHTTVLHAAVTALGRRYREAAAAIRERWRAEAEAIIGARP